MPATLKGWIGDALAPAPGDFAAEIEFSGGWLASSPHYDVVREGDDVCAGCGTPTFVTSELAATAMRRGIAAAWLDAFRQFGEAAPLHVNGRFSVIVVNGPERTVWAASDRFATHSLCYAADTDRFSFSDRADSVAGHRRTLSSQAIFDYLFFHVIPAPHTVFEGVQRLPAGHCVTWKRGRVECRPWWVPRFEEPASDDFATRRDGFMSIVRAGVEREAATGEVGAFLSGGTDSSTVSGMLCEVLGAPARTYSIGFDAAGYDEMEYARLAARRFGTDHHEYYVTPNDLLDGIRTVAAYYDQPFGNSSAVPAWICACRAREDGVTRVLAGDGGDELFGGNARYAKQRVFGLYDSVPPMLRSVALEPLLALTALNRMPLVRKGASYVEQARVPMPDRMQMYNMLIRLGPANVFEPGFLARIDEEEPFRAQREVWRSARADALINRMLAFDWKYTLADNDLPKVIGTTRLAGVGVGFPLLTDELLEFSMKLPPEWKLRRFQLRWFFKEALRGFLPDEIIAKKKHGFGLPFGVWTCRHEGLKALAADALGTFKQRGVVRASFVDALLREHLPAFPGYYGEMVWILVVLEFWIRTHMPTWHAAA